MIAKQQAPGRAQTHIPCVLQAYTCTDSWKAPSCEPAAFCTSESISRCSSSSARSFCAWPGAQHRAAVVCNSEQRGCCGLACRSRLFHFIQHPARSLQHSAVPGENAHLPVPPSHPASGQRTWAIWLSRVLSLLSICEARSARSAWEGMGPGSTRHLGGAAGLGSQ